MNEGTRGRLGDAAETLACSLLSLKVDGGESGEEKKEKSRGIFVQLFLARLAVSQECTVRSTKELRKVEVEIEST